MGAEKAGSISISSGSFFHLLDWSKRARKKVFSDNGSYEGTIQEKQHHRGEHSYASSKTDNGDSVRAPGVVAKLMGLDSLPTSSVCTPCATHLHGSQPLEDGQSQIRSPEIYISSPASYMSMRNDTDLRKRVELRSQKMPSSRIKRFQVDTLPPNSAKGIPATHHKLMSSVKRRGLISAKDVTRLTEAARKNIELELPNGNVGKSMSFKSSLDSSKFLHLKGTIAGPKKTIAESTRRSTYSGAMGSLKGPASSRHHNCFENTTVPHSFPDTIRDATLLGAKADKSISFAIHSKVNVQRRENLRKKTGDGLVVEENEQHNLKKPLKSQSNSQKPNQQRKASATNASSVLKQNNQKQNHVPSKRNLAAKPSTSDQQMSNVLSGNASFGKKKIAEKHTNVSKQEGVQTAQPEKEGLQSKNMKFIQKRKLVEQGSYPRRNGSTNDRTVTRHGKQVRHNVVIDDHTTWRKDNSINVIDVVSFTFTSPIRKSVDVSQASSNEVEKLDTSNEYKGTHGETFPNLGINNLSSSESNRIEGDSLGKLIEEKLTELTSGIHSPYCVSAKGGSAALSASVLDDSASSAISSTFDEYDRESVFSAYDDKHCGTSEPNCCLSTDETSCMSHEPQEAESIRSFNSTLEIEEVDHEDQFPVPNHESSFSNGSCCSPDSCGSSIESKAESHSAPMVALNIADEDIINKTILVQSEMELSDSTSSYSAQTLNGPLAADFSHHYINLWEEDVDYLKDILSSISFTLEDLVIYPIEYFSSGLLDPLLFDELEENRSLTTVEGEGKECRMKRKMLFDSLNECLGLKSSHYFQAGYQSWAKGIALGGNDLAEEVYESISEWTSIGESMVDELVEKDMSSHSWRWIDFEIDAFETGIEIERGVLNSLIEEIVDDLL